VPTRGRPCQRASRPRQRRSPRRARRRPTARECKARSPSPASDPPPPSRQAGGRSPPNLPLLRARLIRPRCLPWGF
jgi:hypothetical protein